MMNESDRVHIEVIYLNNSYEMDVNSEDNIKSIIEDLYFSILVNQVNYSFLEKSINYIKVKNGYYTVKGMTNIEIKKDNLVKYVGSRYKLYI
jgi:hypothetical protein